VTTEERETYAGTADLSDRELLEQIIKRLDHLDYLLHPVHRLAIKAQPLLDRWQGALSGSVTEFLSAGRAARRDRKAADNDSRQRIRPGDGPYLPPGRRARG